MACALTAGYATNCKDTIGGISRLWLSSFGTLSGITLDSDDQINEIQEQPFSPQFFLWFYQSLQKNCQRS